MARPPESKRRAVASAAASAVSAGIMLGSAVAQPNLQGWAEMSRRLVNVRQLIGSEVSNGVTPMGMVRDVVLTPDGTQAQYLLFEVPYPITLWGAEDGFIAFDDATLERRTGLDLQVVFMDEESVRLPDELDLTRESVERRFASHLVGSRMAFEGGETREIRNLLIDRRTGAITHYVVEADPEAIFRSARRAVPTQSVEIGEDGTVAAAVRLEDIDELQEFDPELL